VGMVTYYEHSQFPMSGTNRSLVKNNDDKRRKFSEHLLLHDVK
jgi:hypothetical protein